MLGWIKVPLKFKRGQVLPIAWKMWNPNPTNIHEFNCESSGLAASHFITETKQSKKVIFMPVNVLASQRFKCVAVVKVCVKPGSYK